MHFLGLHVRFLEATCNISQGKSMTIPYGTHETIVLCVIIFHVCHLLTFKYLLTVCNHKKHLLRKCLGEKTCNSFCTFLTILTFLQQRSKLLGKCKMNCTFSLLNIRAHKRHCRIIQYIQLVVLFLLTPHHGRTWSASEMLIATWQRDRAFQLFEWTIKSGCACKLI